MLFHNGDFHFGCTVTPLYFTPVFEEGNIVDGRLDAQDQMEFVVHFDGDLTHAVFDACSLDAGVKIVALGLPSFTRSVVIWRSFNVEYTGETGSGGLASSLNHGYLRLSMLSGAEQFIVAMDTNIIARAETCIIINLFIRQFSFYGYSPCQLQAGFLNINNLIVDNIVLHCRFPNRAGETSL